MYPNLEFEYKLGTIEDYNTQISTKTLINYQSIQQTQVQSHEFLRKEKVGSGKKIKQFKEIKLYSLCFAMFQLCSLPQKSSLLPIILLHNSHGTLINDNDEAPMNE